jgi:pyruvate dehydrogenase E2 component (dihydrolipoamide acetyltransferase)
MPSVADDPSSATLTAWLVGESGDFVGAQSIATVETSSSLLSIEVAEPGILIKSLVEPGDQVAPGSALAVLGAPGEVIDDVEQLMVQLGLAVAPQAQDAGAHLRAVADDPLRATTWPPHDPHEPDDEEPRADEKWAAALVEAASSAPTTRSVTDPADQLSVVHRVVGWTDSIAEAVVRSVRDADAGPEPDVPATATRQVRVREEVLADRMLTVVSTVDGVSMLALVVKAVAVTSRRVPLSSEAPSINDVAVRWWTPWGPAAPVIHVANLMTASSLSLTLADLDRRAREGRLDNGHPEPGSITVVDLGAEGAAEGTVDATTSQPVVLTLGAVRVQPVVDGTGLVPGRVLRVTLSCDAERIEPGVAARWLTCLVELLEQPLKFLT